MQKCTHRVKRKNTKYRTIRYKKNQLVSSSAKNRHHNPVEVNTKLVCRNKNTVELPLLLLADSQPTSSIYD